MDLHVLDAGMPGITPPFGAYLREAAAVCLEEENHQTGVGMDVRGAFSKRYSVTWNSVTAQMRRCLADREVATEHGAYGIAALLVSALTGLTVVERSMKGTGFDYWLGPKKKTRGSGPLFQRKGRLEVSGIRKGTKAIVQARVAQKLGQTRQSDPLRLPAVIVVVEFTSPASHVRTR